MASSDYFLAALLESTRDRCLLPASDDTLSDARLARIINDELQGYMSELLVSTREEYILQMADVTATGQQRVRIPKRAAAASVRQITVLEGADEIAPERIEPERSKIWRTSVSLTVPTYVVEGDDVVFTSAISSQQKVRFRFHYMPKLVDEATTGAVIESIFTNRTSFTYANKTPGPFPPTPGLVDFIRLGGGNQPVGLDTTVQSVTPGTRTIFLAAGQTVPPDISVGDYVIAAGLTVIPPLPEALMPLLCQRAAYVGLRAIGDPKTEAALLQLQEMRVHAYNLMQPRTVSSPRYVMNRHAPGWW